MMINKIYSFQSYLYLLCLLVMVGCDTEQEELPAYLKVESFEITENTNVEEISKSAKIVAANVLVNNTTVGVVSVPGVIPVFTEGNVEIKLDPLVQENGAGKYFQIYPFWKRVTLNTTLAKLDTTVLTATTQYHDNTTILGTNFDNSTTFFSEDLDGDNETAVTIVPSGGQAGEGAFGRISLTSEHPKFFAATSTVFKPEDYTRIWLEVQYKTDVQMTFGINKVGNLEEEYFPEYTVLPKSEWNTIYFDLLTIMLNQGVSEFQLTLSAESDINEAEILLDNIKLVYL